MKSQLKVKLNNVELDPSNKDPKFTDIYKEVYQETDKYSITPRTFKYREFKQSIDELSYKDFFQHVNKDKTVDEVVRFGINVNKIVLDKDNKIFGELDVIDINKKAVSSSKSSQYTLNDVINIKHYVIEKEIMNNAVLHLLDHQADNKTVIVDIFARTNGTIKMIKDETTGQYHPETHAVVLYKNPAVNNADFTKNPTVIYQTNDVLVIDPSNFSYSSHLNNSDIVNFMCQEKDIKVKLGKIVTMHKTSQIYKPEKDKHGNENIGPKSEQYRDCIDIAVKLAFGINSEKDLDIDFSSNSKFGHEIKLDKIKTIVSISNKLDKNIIEVPSSSVRIKQASDVHTVDSFNKAQSMIKTKVKICATSYPDKVNKITGGFEKREPLL